MFFMTSLDIPTAGACSLATGGANKTGGVGITGGSLNIKQNY